jgi:hypothetical protein
VITNLELYELSPNWKCFMKPHPRWWLIQRLPLPVSWVYFTLTFSFKLPSTKKRKQWTSMDGDIYICPHNISPNVYRAETRCFVMRYMHASKQYSTLCTVSPHPCYILRPGMGFMIRNIDRTLSLLYQSQLYCVIIISLCYFASYIKLNFYKFLFHVTVLKYKIIKRNNFL